MVHGGDKEGGSVSKKESRNGWISKKDCALILIVSIIILVADFYTGYEVSCPRCGFRGDIEGLPKHSIWTTRSGNVVCPMCGHIFHVLVYYDGEVYISKYKGG